MSFINENNQPLILTKLTAKGRENIAKGNFTYKYWAIGDSEVDYNCVEDIPENLGSALTILRPKDKNPIFKTFVTKSDCEKLQLLNPADRRVVECCVRNRARSRGFFSGMTDSTIDTLKLINDESRVRNSGSTVLSKLNGTTYLDLQTVDFQDGDFLLLKITLPQTTSLNATETEAPIAYLWYKIDKHPTSSILTLDRKLPDYTFVGADTPVYWYIFAGNDPINNFFATGQTEIVWDSETLEFKPECDITDVNVLNLNNVWNENHAGISGTMFGFKDYGSLDYVGLKEYLGYNELCPESTTDVLADCENKLSSEVDAFIKGIGVIHFSNNTTKNEYGEIFFIDNDNTIQLELNMPTIMWHRRFFNGSALGDKLGMRFISTGLTQDIKNSEIQYFDLVEDPSLIDPEKEPMVVGKVFPNLKIVTIENEELLATMSYKSNRNWSLPKLKGDMIFPINGEGTGVLPRGKTMYMTYVFEADDGVKYQLPQQKYIKFVNDTAVDRDVNFTIEDVNYFPYMRQYEQMSYDGFGFYADKFKVLIQLVDSSSDRPSSDNWTAIDYTSNALTNVNGYTINPINLENQTPETNNFILTKDKFDSGEIYHLDMFNIPATECPELLQFGDERFFFGNLETFIGACIYKSIFNITIPESEFSKSDNPTWDDTKTLHFTEIGIFDDDQQLVLVAKISKPIKLIENSVTEMEISMDF